MKTNTNKIIHKGNKRFATALMVAFFCCFMMIGLPSIASDGIIFTDDMESGQGNWTTSISGGTGSAWALGTPTVGPSSAHSGTKCWGTNLTDKYSGSTSDAQLISPAINLTGLTSPVMTFWMYADIDKKDGGYLDISTDNGTSWSQIPGSALSPTYDGIISGGSVYAYQNATHGIRPWSQVTADLSAYAGSTVKIRFHFITNNDGFRYYGWYIDDVTVGENQVDVQAPSVPVGLLSSNVSESGFTLSWTASTDNVDVTGYDVYKDDALYSSVTTTSANITGLNAGTAYVMTVKAKDAAGNVSAASSQLNVTTSAISLPVGTVFNDNMESGQGSWTTSITGGTGSAWALGTPTVGPSSVHSGTKCWGTNLSDKYSGNTSDAQLITPSIDLSGTISPLLTFWMYVDIDKKDGGYLDISTDGGSTWSQIPGTMLSPTYDGIITEGSVYAWHNATHGIRPWTQVSVDLSSYAGNTVKIRFHFITNNDGFRYYGWYIDDVMLGENPADVLAPTAPTGLTATGITETSFTLSWAASVDHVGVTGYDVYKDGVLCSSGTTTSVSITGVIAGITYSMTVKAKDASGNMSAASAPLSVAIPDTEVPSVPQGLQASSIAADSFTLSWMASTDNVGVTGYDIYKDGAWISTITGTSINIAGLTQTTSYVIMVRAKDAANNISDAAELSVTTSSPDHEAPIAPDGLSARNITPGGFTLSWNASADNVGVAAYDVYKNGALLTSVTATSATITGLTANTTYAMTVRAKDASNNVSAVSSELTVTTIEGAVVYIDPTYTGGQNDGSLEHPYTSWTSIAGYSDNTSYLQKRGTTCNLPNNENSTIAIDEKQGVNFGAYGEGTGYARINYTYRTGATIKIEASLNCVVENLHFTADNAIPDPSDNGTYAVYVVDKEGGAAATIIPNGGNIILKNCLVEHYTWGIRMMSIGYSVLENITVEGCTIKDIHWDGMFIQGWTEGRELRGVDINNCYITNVNAAVAYWEGQGVLPTQKNSGGDAIQISRRVDGWKIRNTTIDRRGSGLKFCIIHGDEGSSHMYGGTVENCTIYTTDRIINDERGTGCYFSILDTVDFINNKIIGNSNSMGIQLRWNTNFNCLYNTFSGFTGADAGLYAIFDVQSDPGYTNAQVNIHNNTFYNIGNVYHYLAGSDAFDFKNNIFNSVNTVYASTANVTSGYNLYYPKPESGAETKSVYGKDPLMNDPANGDFRLRTGSPCINAGVDLGYTTDIAGNTINGVPDIGAYEYSSMDTEAPSIPVNLQASDISYTGFTLSWNASTDNAGVTGYDVYKNGEYLFAVSGTTASILALTQGTTYSMTVKAKDGSGNISATSNTLDVTTVAASDNEAPSVPINLSTSRIAQTNLVLTWAASTDASAPVTYDIYKDGMLYNSTTGTSATLVGLTAGQTYNMSVKARDIYNNTSVMSNVLSVTTLPACNSTNSWTNDIFTSQTGIFTAKMDIIPQGDNMNAIVGLSNGTASAFSHLACILQLDVDGLFRARNGGTYTAVTSQNYLGGASYHVEFVVDLGTHTYDVYVTPEGGSQVMIANKYAFRTEQSSVVQLNNYAKQINTCDLLVSNLSLGENPDTESPTTPDGLLAANITGTGFTLSWNASTDNVGVTGYDVYKDGVWMLSSTGTSTEIAGLTNATAYSFSVKAKDGAGNESQSGNALLVNTPDTESPSAPDGLLAANITGTGFMLSWNASTDNVGVTGYDVYKDGVWILSSTGTSAEITGLTNATAYSFTVKAKDGAGNESQPSDDLLVNTPDTESPTAPDGLLAANITGTGFTLSWNASTDNVGVTGYDVYKDGVWMLSSTGTSAEITGLTNATAYSFSVKAKDGAGNESQSSDDLLVNTPDTESPTAPDGLLAANITGIGFTLSWNASTDNVGVTGYDVYKNGVWMLSSTGTSAEITGLTNATAYSFTVKAKDGAGNESQSSNVLLVNTPDTESPTVPDGLLAANITGIGFTLSWNASTDNVGVTGYDVYKDGVWMLSSTGTSADITGLTKVTAYSFTVKAKDEAGNESPASNTLIVKTSGPGHHHDDNPVLGHQKILVFPNPAHDYIHVKVWEESVVRIRDLSGRVLIRKIVQTGVSKIPLNVRPGIYFVEIEGENRQTETTKLVVK